MIGGAGKNAKEIIDKIIDAEGGYVDDENDLGGATKYGITERVARQNGYTGGMRDLPRDKAVEIYTKQYYIEPGFARIAALSSQIGYELTDTGVNMGTGIASEFLQRCLNVLNRGGSDYPDLVVDGNLGPKTQTALRGYLATRGQDGEEVLLTALNCLQGARYIEISEKRGRNEQFTYGWLRSRVML